MPAKRKLAKSTSAPPPTRRTAQEIEDSLQPALQALLRKTSALVGEFGDVLWHKEYLPSVHAVLENHSNVTFDTLKRRFIQALVRGHNDKAKRGPKFLLLDYEEAELLAWCDFHQQHYQTPDLDEVAGKVWWLHTGFTETCPCMCIVSC